MGSLLQLSVFVLSLVGFTHGLAPVYVDCQTVDSHWDYWWYGASDVLTCKSGQQCQIATSEAKTVSWSVTSGVDFGFTISAAATLSATASYTYGESVTSQLTYQITYNGPASDRLWRKQWFAVNTISCQQCQPCLGIGCKPQCGGRVTSVAWVPCKNGNCIEYQVSDANAQCNSANKCSEN